MATCRLDQESLWYVGILYLLITTSLIHVWEDHQLMASKRCKIETCWIKWNLWQTIWVHDSYTSFFLTKDSDTKMQLEWLVCAITTSPFKLKPYWAPISAFPNSMVSKPSENLEGAYLCVSLMDRGWLRNLPRWRMTHIWPANMTKMSLHPLTLMASSPRWTYSNCWNRDSFLVQVLPWALNIPHMLDPSYPLIAQSAIVGNIIL
jgi:hypothetical protein